MTSETLKALYDRGYQVGASDAANGLTFDLEYGSTVAAAKGYSDGFKETVNGAERCRCGHPNCGWCA